jgi:hypothetical protein
MKFDSNDYIFFILFTQNEHKIFQINSVRLLKKIKLRVIKNPITCHFPCFSWKKNEIHEVETHT